MKILAITLFSLSSAFASGIGDYENHHPTFLRCPSGAPDVVEEITQNGLKESTRVRAHYEKGKITRIEIAAAVPDGLFQTVYDFHMDKVKGADAFHADGVGKHIDRIRKEVCEGSPEARDKYFAELRRNRDMLRQHWAETLGGQSDAESGSSGSSAGSSAR